MLVDVIKNLTFNNWFLHDLTIEFATEIAFIILVHLLLGFLQTIFNALFTSGLPDAWQLLAACS